MAERPSVCCSSWSSWLASTSNPGFFSTYTRETMGGLSLLGTGQDDVARTDAEATSPKQAVAGAAEAGNANPNYFEEESEAAFSLAAFLAW